MLKTHVGITVAACRGMLSSDNADHVDHAQLPQLYLRNKRNTYYFVKLIKKIMLFLFVTKHMLSPTLSCTMLNKSLSDSTRTCMLKWCFTLG